MSYKITHSILALSLATLISSCGSEPQQDLSQLPPQETDFFQVSQGAADQSMSYPGNIEGSVNVDIKPQVSGYLEAIYVKEGDYVRKGQALFRIKGDVFNEQISNSDAALKAALANQATAQLEVDKIKPLVEGLVVSEMQLKSAQAGLQAAGAQVSQAKAALGSSRINANFALIKAPVNGYIGRIPNRIGNLVTPTDVQPMTTLSEISNVFVYFSMSEADFLSHSTEEKTPAIDLIMADGRTYPHKGSLEMASGNIDRNTGSIALKAIFPNPDNLLRAGGSGRVVLHRMRSNVMEVPMTSVKDIQDRLFVFKLADSNKVKMVPITVSGHSEKNYFLSSGLKPGDRIAINRIDALNDGTAVAPKLTATNRP